MNSLRILKTAAIKPYPLRCIQTQKLFPSTSVRFHQTDSKPTKYESHLIYEGGLTKAAKVMKLASVASLIGATAAVPLFFTGDSDVPQTARMILALTTIGMTASSTALVTWALKPYITELHVLKYKDELEGSIPLMVQTMTFWAQPRTRLVFAEQLSPATLPMTSWIVEDASESLKELAKDILEQINDGRKKNRVTLAGKGDLFYAHTQGPVSAEMQKILQAAPSQ